LLKGRGVPADSDHSDDSLGDGFTVSDFDMRPCFGNFLTTLFVAASLSLCCDRRMRFGARAVGSLGTDDKHACISGLPGSGEAPRPR
jgi:hypothetical protein